MNTFLVIRRWGPNWDYSRGLRDQRAWGEHAIFMDEVVRVGTVLMSGPLEGTDEIAQLVSADSAEAATAVFADDPWERMGLLVTERSAEWRLWLGRDRLISDSPHERREPLARM